MSVSFIEFIRKFYVYDEIFDKVLYMLGKRVILATKFERLKIRSNFMCIYLKHSSLIFNLNVCTQICMASLLQITLLANHDDNNNSAGNYISG